jgi:lipid A 3-O-deacylase
MASVRFMAAFRWVGPLVIVLLTLAPLSARAVDGIAGELGWGDDIASARAAVQWDWKTRFLQGANWHVGGYWDVALGYWNHDNTSTAQRDEIYEIGLTPVLRLQPNGLAGPYLEGGIGAHLLSHTTIGNKRLSTGFQFGTHLGFGYRFGAKSAYDVNYRFQQISNADIKEPNPGLQFHQLRLQYHF